MPIASGTYVITNVKHLNPVVLKNANDGEPIQGHYEEDDAIEQWHWHVKDLKNGLHLIQNVKYERYANCGSRASLNADVMGASQKQEWHIQAIGSEGEYTIGAIDSKNFWSLPTLGMGTPVELYDVPEDRKCRWTFTNVETGALVKEDATYLAYLFALQPLPILPFSPLRLDFVIIQEMTDDSISNASRTIAGACGRLVSLGRLQSDALCVNIIEFAPASSGIFFERSCDVVTFEKLRSLGDPDLSWEDHGSDSSLPTRALRGLRDNTTKIAILNFNVTLFQEDGQAIVELMNHLAEYKITLILTLIQSAWEKTFSKSVVFTESKKFYPGCRRFKRDGQFSDYVLKYNETVALPKLKKHPELRNEIRPNIAHIIEVLKDEDQHTRSVAVTAFSHLAEYPELRGVISETTLKIIKMLDGNRDEAEVAASALIALVEHAELCRQAVPRIIEVLKGRNHGPQSAIVEVVSKFTEHTELREVICPAIPGILEVLKDKNHDAQSAVVEVLSQFTQHTELRDAISKAVVGIIEMLKGDGHEVEATASALIKLAKSAELREVIRPATPHIVKILKDTKRDAQSAVVEVLSNFTQHTELHDAISKAVVGIIEMLKGDGHEVEAAASALIKLATCAELREVIHPAIPDIVEILKDTKHDAQSPVVEVLSNLTQHTELHDAIFKEVVRIIEMLKGNSGRPNLFERGGDFRDGNGCTSLAWAAGSGYDAFVRILLAQEGVDTNSKDIDGQTPLSWAACNGHDAVSRLLLAQEGVDADSKDMHGQNPLFWAARNGHDAVVRLLPAQKGLKAMVSGGEKSSARFATMSYESDSLSALEKVTSAAGTLNAMVSGAEMSLLIIAPWHGAETENLQMQQVIWSIAGHCTVYIQAIDASIKTAEDGYSLSSDAVDLCDFILDPDIEAMEIQDYIKDAQSKAKEVHQVCRDTLNKFNAVQMGLIEMSATMPREALAVQERDKGLIARFISSQVNAATIIGRKQTTSIEAAMKDLRLAAMDMVQLSKTISGFVGWWADMETKLVTADKNLSRLDSNKGNKLRVKTVQRKWTEIRGDYANYKVEIGKLRYYYPPGITLGEDAMAKTLE